METRLTPVTSAPVNQTKLELGKPNDEFEHEADRVAEQVTQMPGPAATETTGTLDNMSTGGRSLPESVRAFFEPRFGTDFGGVRIHADAEAGKLSRALRAEAFTLGPDIYFAPGAYRPTSARGRRLLAHELTHVVQQAGARPSDLRISEAQGPSEREAERVGKSVARDTEAGLATEGAVRGPVSVGPPPLTGAFRGIQRRLLVTGKPLDTKALLDLLEPASGFTLKHDPKTKEVSITASVLKPASFVLAGQLARIIGDPDQNAELNVGRRQVGVGFGAFPESESDSLIQTIDVDDLVRVEAKAPGSGVSFLIHEIVENYHAHSPSLQDYPRGIIFDESHDEALEAERLVAGELIGAQRGSSRPTDFGGYVAYAVTTIGPDTIREVDDYEHYFLVIDQRDNVLTDARRVARVNVSRYTIAGFASGADVVPGEAQPTITEVVTDLEKVVDDLVANPTATVRIDCGDPDPKVAAERAYDVQGAILAAGKGRKGWDLRSERNFNLVAFGLIDLGEATAHARRPVITVDRPDTEAEAERGRIVKSAMTGRSQRRAPPKGR